MARPRNFVAWTILGALLSLVIPILGTAIARLFFADFRFTHLPLHSLIEGTGGLVVLAIAGILVSEMGHQSKIAHYPLMAAGLASMGVLDLFHAAAIPGNHFVWLHSLATFAGGAIFGLLWVSDRETPLLGRFRLPLAFAIVAFVVGSMSILFPGLVPTMRTPQGTFSNSALALNGLGGIGFLVASTFFARRFFVTRDTEDWLFGVQSTLFGMAGLLFAYSVLWDGGWWWWHALRLAACVAALAYGLRTFRDAERELRLVNRQLLETNDSLDKIVEQRTASLLAIEERYELAVRGSTDGLWDWNVLTAEVYYSPRMKELLGYGDDEFPNVFGSFETRLHPDDHDWVLREVESHLKHRKPYDVEYRLQTKSDGYHWFRARGQALWNESGQALRMAGSITDITERKLAENEAKLTEHRMNIALDATHMGVWDLDLVHDRAWRSQQHDRVFGHASQLPEWGYETFLSHVVPEDREAAKMSLSRAFETNEFTIDCRIRWPDQSIHWIAAEGHVFRNEQGEPIRMMGLVTSIDERKRREEQFRAMVEAAPSAMLVINSAGEIILINRQLEELFGYERQELIGRQVEILIPERFRADHPRQRQRFFESPVARDMGADRELYGVRRDGTEFPVKVGLSPIESAEGRAVICGIQDITDQIQTMDVMRLAKESAESASRAKSSFLANMSHEIRTPMNGIIGMTQLLAQTELRSHQRDYLATIDESAHILLRLLNDILDFSKIEAGKLELENVDFRISECVARAAQMLVLRAAEKGVEIACRVAPEIPDHLCGDSGRLQQVLVNLLANAVKFTQAGEIFVNINAESATSDRIRLHLSVSDTGIGIPPDKLDQIFRPFEQAEASTTRRFGGTGLGLTISQQLVEMMQGRMWVESESGRGSTFHFTAEFGIADNQDLHEPAELESLRDLPVLVVDDNFTNRRILSEILRHWKMQPVLADSAMAGRNAIRLAEESKRPIRLILLDHHMPGEDGLHFAESIHSTVNHGPCPIIMISSGSSPVDLELCKKIGIVRFMTKPVIASELLNEVLRQFGRYSTAKLIDVPSVAAGQQISPRRVLLVEDNEINRRVAQGLLRSRGHQVTIAVNGQEAVNTLAEQEFDVVLMDMQMPVMDGYEATIEIRKREHQTGGHIPIVAMTAEAMKGDRERCLGVGMDDYVAKPIVKDEVYRAVEQFPALCLTVISNSDRASAPRQTVQRQPSGVPSPATPNHQAPADSPLPHAALPPVDWNVAKERLGDDAKVLRDFSQLLKEQAPQLLAEINSAIQARDFKLLRRSAHTLRGSVIYFGAESVVQLSTALESLGHDETVEGAEQLQIQLEQEVSRVLLALDAGPPMTSP